MAPVKIMYISSLLFAIPCMVNAIPHQQPLTGNYLESSPSAISPNFKRVPQNDTLCDAGSPQWTGTVRVSKDRDIFYWYFESRHDPENAPLIVWMNGGPGGSSMLGALFEIGACSITDDGSSTTRNKNSWNEFANVVFIDQPVGVGLSETKDSNLWAKDLSEASIDFSRFLDIFVEEAFPELESRPIHVAGESFAGKYVPVYVAALRRKLASVILVDPFIDWNLLVLGLYEHMCAPVPLLSNGRQFNATACEEMEKVYPSCDKSARLCDLTYDADTCFAAAETCNVIYDIFQEGVVPGGWDPYDDRRACDEPPLCGGQGMYQVGKYLNSEFARQALGLPDNINYKPVNFEFNERWSNQSETWVPTTREIAKILDVKETPVLVIDGMNDIGINWQGIVQVLNSIQWSGQARFKTQPLKSWNLYDGSGTNFAGGNYKWHDRLALLNVNEAGHMSPHDQPEAVSWAMKKWVAEKTLEGF